MISISTNPNSMHDYSIGGTIIAVLTVLTKQIFTKTFPKSDLLKWGGASYMPSNTVV